jgi:hypothetical protein
MAYRFTNTEKWSDVWFTGLKRLEKLLFLYLVDNCDIAGFIELNYKRWQSDLDASQLEIEGALKGLGRGLIFANTNDCIFIKNFLKHQKNLPLNPENKSHQGILKRFDLYLQKFNNQSYIELIEGALKGLGSPTGIGIGNGIVFIPEKIQKIDTWRTSFEIYKSELNTVYNKLINDTKFISSQERLNPNIDIRLSIEKSVTNYWGVEVGWKNKKATKTKNVDWMATLVNSISQPMNKVWKQKTLFAQPEKVYPKFTDPNFRP